MFVIISQSITATRVARLSARSQFRTTRDNREHYRWFTPCYILKVGEYPLGISDEALIQPMANISSAKAEKKVRIGKRVKDVQASPVVSHNTDENQKESMQKRRR